MDKKSEKLARDAAIVARLLKSLGNPLRLLLVCHLADGELFARELNDRIGTTKGNVSQHLTALLKTRLILRERRGNRNYYRIADPRVNKLMQFLRKAYCKS
jgi:ArsR family transcriptional regulator, virulence genes transcriptional regulator